MVYSTKPWVVVPFLRKSVLQPLVVFMVVAVALSPALFFNYGFHNDYWAWAYDTSQCCSSHPESSTAIATGRALAAYVMNLQFTTITTISDLWIWRAIIIITTAASAAYYLNVVSFRECPDWGTSLTAIGVFVLPTMQLSVVWASNFAYFVCPTFLALVAARNFIQAAIVEQRRRSQVTCWLQGIVLTVIALFFYQPSATLCVVPILHRLLFRNDKNALRAAVAAISGVCLAFGAYFVIQRYMVLPNMTSLPGVGDYRFEISSDLASEFCARLQNNLLQALYLWLPLKIDRASAIVATAVLSACAISILHLVRSNSERNIQATYFASLGAVIAIFLLAQAPILIAAKRSETFRATHAITACVLLVCFWLIQVVARSDRRSSVASGALVAVGSSLAFVSVYNVSAFASTEHRAYADFVARIPSGSVNIVATIPSEPKKVMGLPLRGDFGNLGPIAAIGDLLIGQRYSKVASFELIQVKIDQGASLFVEKGALLLDLFPVYGWHGKRNYFFIAGTVDSSIRRESFGPMNAVDGSSYTFWEVWDAPLPVSLTITFDSGKRMISSYSLRSYEAPERMPTRWVLYGKGDAGQNWQVVHAQLQPLRWRTSETKAFRLMKSTQLQAARLEILDTEVGHGVRIYEVSFL